MNGARLSLVLSDILEMYLKKKEEKKKKFRFTAADLTAAESWNNICQHSLPSLVWVSHTYNKCFGACM